MTSSTKSSQTHPLTDLEAAFVCTLFRSPDLFDALPPTMHGGHFLDMYLGRIFTAAKALHDSGEAFSVELVAKDLREKDADALSGAMCCPFQPRNVFDKSAADILDAGVLRSLSADFVVLSESALGLDVCAEDIIKAAGDTLQEAESTLSGSKMMSRDSRWRLMRPKPPKMASAEE
jgi:hypothetical protein